MDPPAIMNDGSYNLAEIWQFPVNGNGRSQFGQSLGIQFGDSNREVLCCDPMNLEQRGNRGGGTAGARKRRDVVEDDSAKVVSSSNVNGNSNGLVLVSLSMNDFNNPFSWRDLLYLMQCFV